MKGTALLDLLRFWRLHAALCIVRIEMRDGLLSRSCSAEPERRQQRSTAAKARGPVALSYVACASRLSTALQAELQSLNSMPTRDWKRTTTVCGRSLLMFVFTLR